MKKDTHPVYQKVLFVDSASGHRFVCGSTLKPDAREKFEGVDYPVSYLSISSTSHPFFTGSKQLVDSEGRVEKFKKRFGSRANVKEEASGGEEQQKKQEAESQSKEQPKEQPKPNAQQSKSQPTPAKKPVKASKK